jgi:hypothetical protein
MITKFYEKVLPLQGKKYCVAWSEGRGMNHEWVDSISEIEPTIVDLQDRHKEVNIYVAMSTFEGKSRLAKHASYRKCLFVDLDVGKDKAESGKGYATKDEAEQALDKFVEDTSLPPVVKLDSGNGIHGYWPLDKELTIAEWEPYAEKFYNFCLSHNLLVDSSVMCDAARIMRSPGTINKKKDKPASPTKLLTEEINQYSLEDIEQIMGEVIMPIDAILKAAKSPLSEDQRKALKLDNFQSSFETIAKKSLGGTGCNQIKHILVNASTLEEPMWYAGLSIAQHCQDRDTAIHLMSDGHPSYDREVTESKATQSQDKPFSCERFSNLNPGGCKDCSHKNKITNPLALGKEFIPAPPQQINPVVAHKEAPLQSMGGLPKDLHPFVYGGNEGGIYYEYPQEIDDEGQPLPRKKPLMVCAYDLYPINRVYSNTDGECLVMRYHPPNDAVREFTMPAKSLYRLDKFVEIVSHYGVMYDPTSQQGKFLMMYIYKWGDYLFSNSEAEIMRQQMGWTPDYKAFVVGNREMNSAGKISNSPTSPLCKAIAQHLKTEGNYDTWKETANKLNKPSLELHAFIMLTGFGSVLMNKTTTNGMTICLTGSDSGSGKTGALYAALSIWGNPHNMSLVEDGATKNAFVARYLALHNIPFGLDEVGNIEAKELSGLIHKISSGKAKARMQASVNAEREHEGSASLIAVFTSNHSLINRLKTYKLNPNGEMARLLEIGVNKPQIFLDSPSAGKEIFQPFNFNYGHAGFDFISKLFKYSDEDIQKRLDKWSLKFKEDFGDDTTYRFHENMVSATFTAAEIVIEHGIVDLSLDRIYKAIMSEMINIRDHVVGRINEEEYESRLAEYLNAHQSNMLTFGDEGKLVNSPHNSALLIRAEQETNTMYIEKRHFREWLSKIGLSIDDFTIKMQSKGYQIRSHKRRMGTGWKNATGLCAVMTLEFNTIKFLEDIIKDQEPDSEAI